jgi:hypothetical protein
LPPWQKPLAQAEQCSHAQDEPKRKEKKRKRKKKKKKKKKKNTHQLLHANVPVSVRVHHVENLSQIGVVPLRHRGLTGFSGLSNNVGLQATQLEHVVDVVLSFGPTKFSVSVCVVTGKNGKHLFARSRIVHRLLQKLRHHATTLFRVPSLRISHSPGKEEEEEKKKKISLQKTFF